MTEQDIARAKSAPDPARSYERAKPEFESGMGRLDNNKWTPADSPDRMEKVIDNRQTPEHQLNAQDVVDGKDCRKLSPEQDNPEAIPEPKPQAELEK